MSAVLKIKRPGRIGPVKLASLILDPDCQPRVTIDPALVAEYRDALNAGAIFDNIEVYTDGKSFWCADGFHRVMAYRSAERAQIPANIHEGTKRDAILHAVGANDQHGLRRSNADKRRAVEMLLNDEEWSQWSSNQIADQCGVSGTFVNHMRAERTPVQVTTVVTCEPEKRKGKDGKQYTASAPKPKKLDAFEAAGANIDPRITPEVTIPEEITSVEAVIEKHDEEATREADTSDATWLETLPLTGILTGNALTRFHASALLFRAIEPDRNTFAKAAKKAITKAGRKADAFAWAVKSFLGIDHPSRWVRCAPTSEGGCGGSGQLLAVGECQQCHGNGFRVRSYR
ncbi:hypothetical protein UFOVP124_70 [uncultured Caudovirales phage]|uniref:ParB/Sulfiredoxin n=1 Tax=uncultured Caudovirales phage TaxID=2100421 RepID=A0A6J5LDM9_9CAUD|nr:hypothetical protein UFOVP124_70 [uncultured Caudovirales phage]